MHIIATLRSLNPFFIRSVCGSRSEACNQLQPVRLNPFFIRSVCGSDGPVVQVPNVVLIPSSSGQSVVPNLSWNKITSNKRLNPFFIRSVCGSRGWQRRAPADVLIPSSSGQSVVRISYMK